jgi:hypothetical protein
MQAHSGSGSIVDEAINGCESGCVRTLVDLSDVGALRVLVVLVS